MNGPAGGGEAAGEVVAVRLTRLPVAVHHRATQHSAELLREFALMCSEFDETATADDHVPTRLLRLVGRLGGQFTDIRYQQEERLARASENGDAEIAEIVYPVPPNWGSEAAALRRALDEADEYCRSDNLLTLAAPDEVRRYRHWYLGEFTRQTAGEPPVTWPDYTG